MRPSITSLITVWKTITPAVFLLLALVPGGCTEADKSYFPLQEGYKWRYQIRLETSGIIDAQRYYLGSVGQRSVDNEQFHVQQSLTGVEILYRQTDSGLYRAGYLVNRNNTASIMKDEQLIIPTTLEKGFEWENSIRTRLLVKKNAAGGRIFMASVPAVHVIETLEDEVIVPAGRFRKCLKITTNGFAFHSGDRSVGRMLVEIKQSRWFARGVGLVKSVRVETGSSDEFGTRKQTMELASIDTP